MNLGHTLFCLVCPGLGSFCFSPQVFMLSAYAGWRPGIAPGIFGPGHLRVHGEAHPQLIFLWVQDSAA